MILNRGNAFIAIKATGIAINGIATTNINANFEFIEKLIMIALINIIGERIQVRIIIM